MSMILHPVWEQGARCERFRAQFVIYKTRRCWLSGSWLWARSFRNRFCRWFGIHHQVHAFTYILPYRKLRQEHSEMNAAKQRCTRIVNVTLACEQAVDRRSYHRSWLRTSWNLLSNHCRCVRGPEYPSHTRMIEITNRGWSAGGAHCQLGPGKGKIWDHVLHFFLEGSPNLSPTAALHSGTSRSRGSLVPSPYWDWNPLTRYGLTWTRGLTRWMALRTRRWNCERNTRHLSHCSLSDQSRI